MMGLTPRARELLAYIQDRELCPSYEEMAAAIGAKSRSTALRLLGQLEERGYIRRLRNRVRAVEVLRRIDTPTPIPTEPLPRIRHLPLASGRINADDHIEWKRKPDPRVECWSGWEG